MEIFINDEEASINQLITEERSREIKEGIFQTVLIEKITAKEKVLTFIHGQRMKRKLRSWIK
ncbi:hypothetical protein KHA80_16910 [Anaerobacillus sp. HL2]|nr:hypothetical protein KHA80_16910 [Anaerobacillus sp. HL2]